jgi:hypothetical protein
MFWNGTPTLYGRFADIERPRRDHGVFAPG